MRYVALDYGLARTGVAFAEGEEAPVLPVETVHAARFPNRHAFLDALAERIVALRADCCVIGLPIPLDGGEESLSCRQIRNAARRLARRIAIPIVFENEALTSEEAWETLREAGIPQKKRRAVLDQESACLILSSYLAGRGRV
ncbi:MAG: Holliday junction resolvase RuvX [Desulfovibrionaceae bacterium]|nr:Holliday junction resolvase RuvX [Desulfovibrionaceae bacterium]